MHAESRSGDRRGSARSRVFMVVHAGPERTPLWAWDIGLTGLQCRSQKAILPGTYVDLRFRLPGSTEELHAGAQVVTMDAAAEGAVLGLRFCRLSAAVELAIYRFLDQRRALWEEERRFDGSSSLPYRPEDPTAEPVFEPLLREAHAALQARKLRRSGGFFRRLLRAA